MGEGGKKRKDGRDGSERVADGVCKTRWGAVDGRSGGDKAAEVGSVVLQVKQEKRSAVEERSGQRALAWASSIARQVSARDSEGPGQCRSIRWMA